MNQLPAESLLQALWHSFDFARCSLFTTDGRRISVLDPGTPNCDGGPDFCNARIRIGSILYRGDVEIHTNGADWERHSHASNPRYNSVILHVVLNPPPLITRTMARRAVPLLILRGNLHRGEFILPSELSPLIPCADVNTEVPAEVITSWLAELQRERLENTVHRLEARLQELASEIYGRTGEPVRAYHGNPDEIPIPSPSYTHRQLSGRDLWEQLLYEEILQGLGYAKNTVPFRALGRSIRLGTLRAVAPHDAATRMSILFGASGLLPSTRGLPEKESRLYVRRLRRIWRTCKPFFHTPLLHEAEWQFFRLRPANFPTARLAAFCFLFPPLFQDNGFRALIQLFQHPPPDAATMRRHIQRLFRISPDEYWKHHFHFRGTGASQGVAIGPGRIDTIAINVIIPIAILYARFFKKREIESNARRFIADLRNTDDNATVRLLHRHLVHNRFPLDTAEQQQGALQLYSLYCVEKQCTNCKIGQLLMLSGKGEALTIEDCNHRHLAIELHRRYFPDGMNRRIV